MTDRDVARLHERIDEQRREMADQFSNQNKEMARLSTAVEKHIALCEQCRPKVMGNGKEGLDTRMARLEERYTITKGFLLGALTIAGSLGGLAVGILQIVLK